jgi:hypothetical protein
MNKYKLQEILTEASTGLINHSLEHLSEGIVCRINVKSSKTPTYYNGKIYVSNGRQAEEKKNHELTMWIQDRTNQ